MNRLANWVRTGLLTATVLAVLTGGTTTSVAAQNTTVDFEPEFYVSELSDLEIEISGREFDIYDVELQEYAHGHGELVSVSSLTAFLQIAFFDDTDTNHETLEIYTESFESVVDHLEIIDQGQTRDTVYTFAVANYSDVNFYFYLAVTEDVVGNVDMMQTIHAINSTFFEDLASAQGDVVIGGEGFLADVDIDDLMELVGSNPDSGTGDEVALEEAEEPGADGGETRRTASGEVDHAFEIVPAELAVEGDASIAGVVSELPAVEQVQLQLSGSGAAALVQMMRNPMNSESTLDFMLGNLESNLDSMENIGTDATATNAWSIDVGEVGDDRSIIFVWVDSARYHQVHYVEVLIASEATFLDDLDRFTAAVSVDGESVFSGLDRMGIESLFSDDRSEGRVGGDDSRTSRRVDNDKERSRTGRTGSPDAESQGLISDDTYESPQHGVVIEWDSDAWTVDSEKEASVTSDTDTGVDTLVVSWGSGDVLVTIKATASQGEEIEDIVSQWEIDEVIISGDGTRSELVLADTGRWWGAAVYISESEAGSGLVTVHEVLEIDDDTLVYVTIVGPSYQIVGAYADADDHITINGGDAVGTFTPRELDNAIAP